jgi:hypothetical protein
MAAVMPRSGLRRDVKEAGQPEVAERREEHERRHNEHHDGQPRLDPLDASVAEQSQYDHDGLTEDREQYRTREAGEVLDYIIQRDPGEQRLYPAPSHQDDEVEHGRQVAATTTKGTSGQDHRRQSGARADSSDEHQHRDANECPEHDDQ